jgi:2-succinyl-5-enolpyruvyl-6-hydroxy-3-cyclohexene-1-carboxylate synthase
MSEADALAWHGRANGAPWVSVTHAQLAPDGAMLRRLASQIQSAKRPLMVCGPQFDAALATPLATLARTLGAPLLADPLSQLRWGSHDRSAVVDRYDAALRHEDTAAALAPDLILRLGGVPTSKALLTYLQRNATVRQIVLDAATWSDPTLLAAEMVHADPRLVCERLLEHLAELKEVDGASASWLAAWRDVDDRTGAALTSYVATASERFEGRALAEVAALVPSGGTLFVSSSMPVRDLDAFAPGDERSLRVLANRGANGIDGVVSTALGVSAAAREQGNGPLVLVIGDLAFYHDMNGLLAARLHALDATIVVINNDGGGIFSFLPQAAHPAHFEQLFGTPHGMEFAPVAELYGARYCRADSWEALRSAVGSGVSGRGLHIVELRTDRERNVVLHRDAWTAVAATLDERKSERLG